MYLLPTSHFHHAFTLIETLIASTILAVAVAGLVMPFSLAADHQRIEAIQVTAISLAGQMVERCLTQSYAQVVAMNGRVESGVNITGPDDQPLNNASLAGYTLAVSAVEVAIPAGTETLAEATSFCVLKVTVSHTDIEPVVLSRLIAPPVP